MAPRHDTRRGATSRLAPALALLLVGALAACSGGGPECAPSDVFETDAGPEDVIDTTAEAADEVGEARLLHEEGDYAYFLVEQPEARGQTCVWVERESAYVSSGCSTQGVTLMSDSRDGMGVAYDARGDVESEAPSGWRVVDSCLAIRV